MAPKKIRVRVPINIALIKYWGKRDSSKMLPVNDSISISIDELHATTKISCDSSLETDLVTVNGKQMDCGPDSRFHACFSTLRRMLRKRKMLNGEGSDRTQISCKIKAESVTNFPVEAGLASSAAGFAALAFGLGKLFDLDCESISYLARIGSGSACRGVFSGFVQWIAGTEPGGADCTCKVLSEESHWPQLRAIIAVTSDRAKTIGSTDGMQRTVKTSQLYTQRVDKCVPERVEKLTKAIEDKDFETLARITMQDSNQLHSICLDSFHPLQYLTDSSWHIIRLVHAYNDLKEKSLAAYTFDAGPNACIFVQERDLSNFLSYLLHYCPSSSSEKFIRGTLLADTKPVQKFLTGIEPLKDCVNYVVLSRVGGGPSVLEA